MGLICKRLLCLLALLPLAGCSLIELAYDSAPAYLEETVDEAFSLTEAQHEMLEPRIAAAFRWHRRHELPRYAQVLERAAANLDDGLQGPDVLLIVESLRAASKRVLEQALPDMVDFLVTIEPEQLIYYEEARAERVEEGRGLLTLTTSDRQEKVAEKQLERFEQWFGSFHDEQREQALAALSELPDFHSSWMAYRAGRHEAFVSLMRSEPSRDEIEKWIRGYLIERRLGIDADYEKVRLAYWRSYGLAADRIGETLTAEQIERARDELLGYAEDLREMSGVE